MKPVKSQKVLVLVDPGQNGGEDAAPAVITAVLPDGSINVHVFPNRPGPEYSLTGIRLYETREDALTSHSAGMLSAYPVRQLVHM